jgi:outer membrane protein
MRRSFIPVLIFVFAPTIASADVLGVKAGASYWNYDISGTARYKTRDASNNIDINNDLGYDDGSSGFYYVSLEHPLPFLPNVRLSYTNIDEDANGLLSRTVLFGDTTFLINENVSSQFDLKQTDVTLYYELLDNVVSLDLGINAKYIDGKAQITGSLSGTENTDISGWVPMAYGGVRADLPLTGFSVSADGSYVKYEGSSFYDYSVRASYTTPWRVGLDIGYRKIKLDLDDFDDSFTEVEFDGPYAGAHLAF